MGHMLLVVVVRAVDAIDFRAITTGAEDDPPQDWCMICLLETPPVAD